MLLVVSAFRLRNSLIVSYLSFVFQLNCCQIVSPQVARLGAPQTTKHWNNCKPNTELLEDTLIWQDITKTQWYTQDNIKFSSKIYKGNATTNLELHNISFIYLSLTVRPSLLALACKHFKILFNCNVKVPLKRFYMNIFWVNLGLTNLDKYLLL